MSVKARAFTSAVMPTEFVVCLQSVFLAHACVTELSQKIASHSKPCVLDNLLEASSFVHDASCTKHTASAAFKNCMHCNYDHT